MDPGIFFLSRGGEWSGREGRLLARGNVAKRSAANANQKAAAHLLARLNAVLAGRGGGQEGGLGSGPLNPSGAGPTAGPPGPHFCCQTP